MNALDKLLLRISGIEPGILARCHAKEQNRYKALALLFCLMLPIEVLLGFGHLFILAKLSPVYFAFSLLIALVVTTLAERSAIVTMAGNKLSLPFWLRSIFIAVIGLVVTISFLLLFYGKEVIKQGMDDKNHFQVAQITAIEHRLNWSAIQGQSNDAKKLREDAELALAQLPAEIMEKQHTSNVCSDELQQLKANIETQRANYRQLMAVTTDSNNRIRLQNAIAELRAKAKVKQVACNGLKRDAEAEAHAYKQKSKHTLQVATEQHQAISQALNTTTTQLLTEQKELIGKTHEAFDNSITSQVMILASYLNAHPMSWLVALVSFLTIVLMSGAPMWHKLSIRGGQYDQLIVTEDNNAKTDARAARILHQRTASFHLLKEQIRQDSEKQTLIELHSRLDPLLRDHSLSTSLVSSLALQQIERYGQTIETLADSGLPDHVHEHWLKLVEASCAADQASLMQWLTNRHLSTGQPLPPDWPAASAPSTTAPPAPAAPTIKVPVSWSATVNSQTI